MIALWKQRKFWSWKVMLSFGALHTNAYFMFLTLLHICHKYSSWTFFWNSDDFPGMLLKHLTWHLVHFSTLLLSPWGFFFQFLKAYVSRRLSCDSFYKIQSELSGTCIRFSEVSNLSDVMGETVNNLMYHLLICPLAGESHTSIDHDADYGVLCRVQILRVSPIILLWYLNFL